MKQLLTLFLLVSFLAQTFGQAFIFADYYIHKAAFAKNCENKDKPKLKCNGKCQIVKKLKEQEKKEQPNSAQKSAYKNITISSKSFFAAIGAAIVSSPVFYPGMNSAIPVDRTSGIFHPPKSVAAVMAAYG
ncbi:MAG: hypothetical protein Q8941_21225 [Bacteroidota bacterium]|nr:hypothetical protein [Bacteroidota bacterium]